MTDGPAPTPRWAHWVPEPDTGAPDGPDDLVQLLWSGLRLSARPWSRSGDRSEPPGQPSRDLQRRAADLLLDLLDRRSAPHPGDPARRALSAACRAPTPVRRRADLLEVLDRTGPGDPLLLAFLRWRTAVESRRCLEPAVSIDHARFALRALERVDDVATSSLTLVAAGVPGADPPAVMREVLRHSAWASIVFASRTVGRFALNTEATRGRLHTARAIASARPDLLAAALAGRAVADRNAGDLPGMRRVLDELEHLWVSTGRLDLRRRWLYRAMETAEYVGDLAEARRLLLLRISCICEEFSGRPLPEPTPKAAAVLARELQAGEAGILVGDLGQIAFDLASWELLQAEEWSTARIQETRQWIAVAHSCWPHGGNGRYAVQRLSTQLEVVTHPAAGPSRRAEWTSTFLRAAARSTRSTSLVAALRCAADVAPADDPRIRGAIEAHLGATLPRDRGSLLGALARWAARGADTPARWLEVHDWATAAADVLRWTGTCLDPAIAGDALLVAADALRNSGGAPERELLLLLGALRCLGLQLTSVVAPVDRARLGTVYAAGLRRTMSLAAERGDVRAVDLLLETVRRDRTGALLLDLATDPGVGRRIRDAARAVLVANRAATQAWDSAGPPLAP